MRDPSTMSPTGMGDPGMAGPASDPIPQLDTPTAPTPKKSRTNTPWSPAEENLLRQKRDQGQTWGEIAKVSQGGSWGVVIRKRRALDQLTCS